MADTCIECDVAIVGSGFAGSLIAKELSQKRTPDGRRLNIVILEAGPGVQPNINDYMRNFYKASGKVPESPYPPALWPRNDPTETLIDPAKVAAGRPTVRSKWDDPSQSYLDQKPAAGETRPRLPF